MPQTKKPDWDRIYSLERDLYQRTFEHLGAPPPQNRALTFIAPLIGAHLSSMNVEQQVARARAITDAEN